MKSVHANTIGQPGQYLKMGVLALLYTVQVASTVDIIPASTTRIDSRQATGGKSETLHNLGNLVMRIEAVSTFAEVAGVMHTSVDVRRRQQSTCCANIFGLILYPDRLTSRVSEREVSRSKLYQ